MNSRVLSLEQLEAFRCHLLWQEKSEATVKKYLHDVGMLYATVGRQPITKEGMIAYKEQLQNNYAVRSVNCILAALNSLFEFLGWCELKLKSVKYQREVYRSEEKELTFEEYECLVKSAETQRNERLSLILQTICGTGMRVSELRFITVEAAQRGEATVRAKGKTRRVFIVKSLQKKLIRYAAKQGITRGMIFVTRTGKAVGRTCIWREMKRLCRRANVNPHKVFPHNLRHLFARAFYGVEKDIAKLADVLGHSSVDTTRIYLLSTGAEHRRCMEALHLIL